jgi:hypothetical protein
MPGPEHLRKLKSRRVVHKSTGGVLPRTPEPVDPVGNPPSAASFNTVAHLKSSPRGKGEERRAEVCKGPSDKGRLARNRNLESRANLSGQGWAESDGFDNSSPRAFISVPKAVQSPARIASIARL